MFTGIVKYRGEVAKVVSPPRGFVLRVHCAAIPAASIEAGNSLAINGICLTVRALENQTLSFDLSQETLDRTMAGHWQAGQKVNIEPALRLGEELGGHLVTGHIDGIGSVVRQKKQVSAVQLFIKAPSPLLPLLAEKGSIAVDGVSLTINDVKSDIFSSAIVPWTQANTIIGDYREGERVHLEADILARYAARQLSLKE